MNGTGETASRWTGEGARLEWWRPDPPRGPSRADAADVHRLPDVADSRVAFWGLLAFTFVLLISPQTIVPALKPLRLAFVSAAGSAVALLVYRFRHGRPLAIMTREMWILAALAGWAIVLVPTSYWPGGSAAFLVGGYFKSLAIFWLLANALNTIPKIRRVVWALTVMAVPMAVAGLRHFLLGVSLGRDLTVRDARILGYVAPLTENPNDLALMLNLLLPLAVALLLLTKRHAVRLALLAVIGLDVAAVIVTFSRGGFITLGLIFLLYLWKFRGRSAARAIWGLILFLVVVLLAGAPLLPRSYVDRLSTITDIRADRTGSAEARWEDTFAALRLVQRNPIIGAGAGQNVLALNHERGQRWTQIHNVYLQYAVDLGLPGLVLFLLVLACCLRCTASVQRETAGRPAFRDLFCFAEGVQVSLVAFAAGGVFHPVAYHFYFYYLGGLALALRETWRALGHPRADAAAPAVGG